MSRKTLDQHTESIRPISWEEGRVVMLDQRRLPDEEVYNVYCSVDEVAEAIQSMVIRGAPAVGIAAAMGVAVAVHSQPETESIQTVFDSACAKLQATRPTARNLFWALERMRIVFMQARDSSHQELKEALLSEALLILGEDVAVNRRMGNLGQTLIPDDSTVLTYCNTGALATGGYGTALGVIRAAVEAGKRVQVVACETRPYLQGARLTCWEMIKEGIPCTLIADNMAGH
ncbi:MAG: S-methyl-5-thioribose-1-phosphate isomerase, partial [Acidobacteriota bacterium]